MDKTNETKTNEVTERILEVYKILTAEKRVASVKDLAARLQIIPQVFYNMQQGKQNASVDFIQKFIKTFDVSAEFLFTGDGEPFTVEKVCEPIPMSDLLYQVTETTPVYHKANNVQLVPAALKQRYAEASQEEVDKILINARMPMFRHGEMRGFEIDNECMLLAGQRGLGIGYWVFGSRASKERVDIKNGRVYVIVTSDTYYVRRVYVDSVFTLKPDNDDYPTVYMHGEEIKELWYIHSFVGYNMPPPNQVDNLIKSLTASLRDMAERQERVEEQMRLLHGNNKAGA